MVPAKGAKKLRYIFLYRQILSVRACCCLRCYQFFFYSSWLPSGSQIHLSLICINYFGEQSSSCQNRKPKFCGTKTENRSFVAQKRKTEVLWHKNRKTDLKIAKTAKPKIPMPPSPFCACVWPSTCYVSTQLCSLLVTTSLEAIH